MLCGDWSMTLLLLFLCKDAGRPKPRPRLLLVPMEVWAGLPSGAHGRGRGPEIRDSRGWLHLSVGLI